MKPTLDQHFDGDYDENHRLAALQLSYPEICLHASWQQKSANIKIRDGWECRRCGNKEENLQAHHCYKRRYSDGNWAVPWDYPNSSLITLCATCHREEEKKIKQAKEALIHALAESGASSRDYEKLAQAIKSSVVEKNIKKAIATLAWSMERSSRFEKLMDTYDKWLLKQAEKRLIDQTNKI